MKKSGQVWVRTTGARADEPSGTYARYVRRSGFRNSDLREHLPAKSPGQVSRLLKRMWTHGLIKKVGGTYKYYVSELGRIVITAGLKLKNLVLIPELVRSLPA